MELPPLALRDQRDVLVHISVVPESTHWSGTGADLPNGDHLSATGGGAGPENRQRMICESAVRVLQIGNIESAVAA